MQAINFIVITSAVLCLSSAKTYFGADESLTYECTSTLVIITGKNATNYGSIFAVGTNGTNNRSECSVNRTTQNESTKFEISGCIVTKPITVIMMEEKQNLNQPDMVLGGKLTAEYELQCNDVYLGGVTMNKTFNLTKVGDLTVDTSHHQPTFTLNMTIQTADHKTPNNTVLIGTDLLLVITGTHGFRMHPQSCSAKSSPNVNGHVKPLITNGVTDDPMTMTNFSTQALATMDNETDIIEAHLYAFHFIDTYTIYVECTVSVCQNDDASCPASSTTKLPAQSTTTKTTPGTTHVRNTPVSTTKTETSKPTTTANGIRKKRRVSNTVPREHTVRTTLRVVDNYVFINNTPVYSSAFRVSSLWTISTLMCLALQVARH